MVQHRNGVFRGMPFLYRMMDPKCWLHVYRMWRLLWVQRSFLSDRAVMRRLCVVIKTAKNE